MENRVKEIISDYEAKKISLSEFHLALYKLQESSKMKLENLIKQNANVVTLLLLATYERTNPLY